MTEFARRLHGDAERHRVRTLARTLWLHTHLADFLRACDAAALPVIVLKGAALAETVYPDLGLRDFRDLDILIRPADAPRARAVLEGLGYARDETHWREFVAGRDGQADFAKDTPAGPVVLELHTDFGNNDLLQDQVRWDAPGVWARSRPATLAGVPARVLGPEDQLLHLCLHLAGHYLSAPRSLWDIVRVCAVQSVDWDLFVRLAQSSHGARIASVGLRLAVRLLDASVPPAVLAALMPRPAPLLEHWALLRALDPEGRRTNAVRLPLLLLMLDRPQRLPLLLRRLLVPSRRWWHDHRTPPSRRGSPPHPAGEDATNTR